jgi:hypothetical protein
MASIRWDQETVLSGAAMRATVRVAPVSSSLPSSLSKSLSFEYI